MIPEINKRFQRGDFFNLFALVAMSGDLVMVFSGFVVAYWLRFDSGWISLKHFGAPPPFSTYLKLIVFGSVIVLFGLPGKNLYAIHNLLYPRRVLLKLVATLVLCVFVFAGITMAVRTDPPISRWFIVLSLILIFTGNLAWRFLFSGVIKTPFCLNRLRSRVLVLGSWGDALRVQAGIADQDDLTFIGWVPIDSKFKPIEGLRDSCLGQIYELDSLLRLHGADIVVLTQTSGLAKEAVISIMRTCENEHVQFRMVPQFFEILISSLRPSFIGGLPVLGMDSLPLDKLSNRFKKRAVDIVGSIIGLTIFSPIIAFFAVCIFFEDRSPIFFRQERVGAKGRIFKMLKLRSMRNGADKQDHLNQSTLRDDPRMLKIGAFMRKWNIDEMPQFWNVLKGEMSLVGPRPERPFHSRKLSREIPHYNARYMYPPGITGWAQVNGWRGDTSLVERIRHDIWYMEHWSLWLDFRIMFQTFYKRKNAY